MSQSRNLDLLRALAVLFVFVSHLVLTLTPGHELGEAVHTPWIALLYGLGNIGVLFFFVHTSLVLMLSMERRRSTSLFVDFYVRRIFRIYPLSIACILVALLLRIPFVPRVEFVFPTATTILSNLLLIQNLTEAKEIISPLWTLPREVQMYAILPVLFAMLRSSKSVLLVLILWAGAALAALFANILIFVPCFMGGVLAYQLSRRKTLSVPAYFWPVALLLLVSVQLAIQPNTASDIRQSWVLCLVAGGLVPNFRELSPSWLTSASHIVARYSYGIYLFHLPVIWFVFIKLDFLPSWLQWISLCVLMCVIPWMAYTHLESPMIKTGGRIANRSNRATLIH